jgi:hypothetical protein
MEERPITARSILDILGAPREYIEKALKDHVEKLKKEGLKIVIEKYEPAKPQDKLFTTFAELQIEFKNAQELLDFCFDSMPSSVEIISPDQIVVNMQDLTALLNDFQAKLHHTDMMLKGIQAQKEVLDRNAINIFHNFIKFACATKPHTIEELSNLLGVQAKELTPFAEHLAQKGIIKKEGDKYTHG